MGHLLLRKVRKMVVLQLTQFTSPEGVLLGRNPVGPACGPYLAAISENPMNGSAGIRVMPIDTKDEAMKPDGVQGWLYRGDGRIMSNVAGKCRDGTRYEDM